MSTIIDKYLDAQFPEAVRNTITAEQLTIEDGSFHLFVTVSKDIQRKEREKILSTVLDAAAVVGLEYKEKMLGLWHIDGRVGHEYTPKSLSAHWAKGWKC